MQFLKKRLFWIIIILVTLSYGIIYVSVQQALRKGANEPQRSMAQDIARQLDEGRKPEDLLTDKTDIGSNMAPFVIVYDKFGSVVAGEGYIDGTIPQVPIGVLSASQGNKVNSVTWQPKDKIRVAAVSVEADNYYVLGGRSLAVVEKQISSFTWWLIAAWLLTLAVLVGSFRFLQGKPKSSPVSDSVE